MRMFQSCCLMGIPWQLVQITGPVASLPTLQTLHFKSPAYIAIIQQPKQLLRSKKKTPYSSNNMSTDN